MKKGNEGNVGVAMLVLLALGMLIGAVLMNLACRRDFRDAILKGSIRIETNVASQVTYKVTGY